MFWWQLMCLEQLSELVFGFCKQSIMGKQLWIKSEKKTDILPLSPTGTPKVLPSCGLNHKVFMILTLGHHRCVSKVRHFKLFVQNSRLISLFRPFYLCTLAQSSICPCMKFYPQWPCSVWAQTDDFFGMRSGNHEPEMDYF